MPKKTISNNEKSKKEKSQKEILLEEQKVKAVEEQIPIGLSKEDYDEFLEQLKKDHGIEKIKPFSAIEIGNISHVLFSNGVEGVENNMHYLINKYNKHFKPSLDIETDFTVASTVQNVLVSEIMRLQNIQFNNKKK